MIFKCKICAGELNIQKGQNIVECEYCGVKQALPRFFDENTKLMYDRANNYLSHNEFDKAENIYNQILLSNTEDSETYWNLVLCKYGVTYVKDPKTEKYIPTCNRTHYTTIFNDENYQKAIKYANEEKSNLYKTDAKTIDDIQREIIAISKHEKPFDIFISYKETDINGNRTKDSVVAQNLYNKLTSEGYKVFFSRITLEDKIGTEYEPYIYAALASSKVMITVCSSKSNIEAIWVKNEWLRFLSFSQRDISKTLIPTYFDMQKSDLPPDFAMFSAYDINENGFEQELIRGIKKLIPHPITEQERRKKRNNILKHMGIAVAVCAIIGVICAVPWLRKLPEYHSAMQLYYDKNYPEATWAFDEIGNYRNSKKMKEKCENSWRKCLATTAINNETEIHSKDAYYINANGAVAAFPDYQGSANSNIAIDKHGKIVSISACNPLYALHEDGYMINLINNLSENLNDIIQISPIFNTTNIVLKSNGTIIYEEPTYADFDDDWLSDTTNWNNIVDFDCSIMRYGYGGVMYGAIVGVKSDGTICMVGTDMSGYSTLGLSEDIIKKFYDVKKADIYCDFDNLNIVALTKHGTLLSYIDGTFTESDATNIIDISIEYSYENPLGEMILYELHSDGKLYEMGSNNYILEDVIRIFDDFAITRNGGTIYKFNNGKYESTGSKTQIFDEWL